MTATDSNTAAPIDTRALEVPGARLVYDVRGDLQDRDPDTPVLLLAGCPMDASGFVALASHFADRPVVTYDPRGTGRSVRTDAPHSTPELHADDLHRLIETLDVGAIDLFGTSGGAVNGLALVSQHPGQVHTLVAHEPPACPLLPDSEQILAVCRDIYDTYQRSGTGPAMAKFIALVSRVGSFPDTYLDEPAPDPAAFGLPTDDDGSRDDALLSQNLLSCTSYRPDFDALTAASTRVIAAAGRESDGQVAARATAEIARRLGVDLTMFPGDHGGFMGAESGMPGDPEAFAAKLREVLDRP
ncbi:alpha/beta fold hydrolase [Rhodococcus chondri]|uniref:Alpha/beta hydrolase n=1 Tax=Rhodococcus chondri TaxID=3065941 RepID=A0ABU7JVF3_9NOCA|nr:alpha/beta hydrolase [Rhodococcus sp. CC-R104]MEE2034013.1 alpha/beta hydrolase [Rhodococcus sp. CC-R104]